MSQISKCPNCDALIPVHRFRTECPRCGKPIGSVQEMAKQSDPSDTEDAGTSINPEPAEIVLPVPEPWMNPSGSSIFPALPLESLDEFEISKPRKKRTGPVTTAGAKRTIATSTEPPDLSTSSVNLAIRVAKSRRIQPMAGVWILLLCFGSIAVVVATVIILMSLDISGTDTLASNDGVNGGSPTGSSLTSDVSGPSTNDPDADPPVAKVTERPVQLHFNPKPLRYFREEELTSCWDIVRQSTLELEVTRDGATWFVPGVILDARGWVATSYSAVAGASSIVARLAPTSPDEPASRRDLSATVTRFVAADPEIDLVMLEVDRRLIEIIRPIELLPRTPVGGTYLIGIGPVFEGWKRWAMETQIAGSANTELVGKSFEHDRPANAACPGTPLFDPQGRLAGISTARFSDGKHRAVDSAWISAWVSELKSRHAGVSATQPLGSLDRGLAIVEYQAPSYSSPPQQTAPPTKTTGIDVANPVQPQTDSTPAPGGNRAPTNLQRQLQSLVEECRRFGFVPTSAEEVKSLRAFANSLDQARTLLEIPDGAEGSLNRNEWRILDRINENVMDTALDSVAEVNRFRLAESNKLALDDLANTTGDGNTILFADTLINSMTSPQLAGQPTAVFEVLGQETGIIVVVDPERYVFRDGTRWMLVGTIQATDAQSIRTREDKVVQCHRFELLLPVGPLR